MSIINSIIGVDSALVLEEISHIVSTSSISDIFGHASAALSLALNDKPKVLHLTKTTPFELGKEQGKALKSEIRLLMTVGLRHYVNTMGEATALQKAKELEPFIPEEYKQEMKGIAAGSELSYDQVLIANTILDTMNLFGCSVYGISHDPSAKKKNATTEIATNHFAKIKEVDIDGSYKRYDTLQATKPDTSDAALKKALLDVNAYDTIQSIVFDVRSGDISLATGQGYAAKKPYHTFTGRELFNKSRPTTTKVVKLARNLDWPMPTLGPATMIFVRPSINGSKKTAIVGWPGLIGALSGINEDGTALAISVVPSKKQKGMPNQFLFRKILEKATTTKEAQRIVTATKAATPMNLIVAATNGVARFELDPKRKEKGAAITTFGKIRQIKNTKK